MARSGLKEPEGACFVLLVTPGGLSGPLFAPSSVTRSVQENECIVKCLRVYLCKKSARIGQRLI